MLGLEGTVFPLEVFDFSDRFLEDVGRVVFCVDLEV